jgi:sugar transferase (PEP-CTERM system associated)
MAKQTVSKQKIFLLAGDILLLLAAFTFASYLRLQLSLVSYLISWPTLLAFLALLLGFLAVFYILDLYNPIRCYNKFQTFYLVTGALFLLSLYSMMLFYVIPFGIGRGIFLIAILVMWPLLIFWRYVYMLLFRLAIPFRNLVIVGNDIRNDELSGLLREDPQFRILGTIHKDQKRAYASGLPYLGDRDKLQNTIKEQTVHDIVVTAQLYGEETLEKLLLECKLQGINVYDFLTFYEITTGKIHISHIKPYWLLTSDGFNKLGSKFYVRSKRTLDILIAAILIVLTLPLALLIGLGIIVTSKGPILFVQTRMGENQKSFRLIKFRTMIKNAESGAPQWAEHDDSRITLLGRLLRKTRLDELPQMLNILRGEMSLIGPRPEREYFIKELVNSIPFYGLRFTVKPGLTGWAQVNYSYGSSEKDALEKLKYDLYYIKNMSLALDFKIFLKTFTAVLFGFGR